ncbi:MAG: OmpH family outer membrane protein [Planctomycetes bacterium]|nr:OmpH family outer membrane protein [Planctomycetota bacterium]
MRQLRSESGPVCLIVLALSILPIANSQAADVPGTPHTVRRLDLDAKLPTPESTSPPLLAAQDGVRVVDMKKLFEGNERFKEQMKALKAEFDVSAARVQAERAEIIKLQGDLKTLPAGLPEYTQLEETILTRQSEWKLAGDKQLREFRQKESKILWNTYSEIQNAVGAYCKANGVTMVVQFNSAPPDASSPNAVVSVIGRPMVYVDPSRDITPAIEKAINNR